MSKHKYEPSDTLRLNPPATMAPPAGTVVASTANCEVVLDAFGFYARCGNCPYVSEYTAAKFRARQWAEAHDEDQPGDHRAS
jgi:hypothetical protein